MLDGGNGHCHQAQAQLGAEDTFKWQPLAD